MTVYECMFEKLFSIGDNVRTNEPPKCVNAYDGNLTITFNKKKIVPRSIRTLIVLKPDTYYHFECLSIIITLPNIIFDSIISKWV